MSKKGRFTLKDSAKLNGGFSYTLETPEGSEIKGWSRQPSKAALLKFISQMEQSYAERNKALSGTRAGVM